jgi:hypothetical protein
MSPKCELFVKRLQELQPAANDPYLVTTLYDLCDLLREEPYPSEVIPYIFRFFERYPEADFGSPGPLVHFLEAQREYQGALIASIRRRPMLNTVLMVNRILNSKLSMERREFFLDLLLSVLTNPQSDECVNEVAELLLKRQTSR